MLPMDLLQFNNMLQQVSLAWNELHSQAHCS